MSSVDPTLSLTQRSIKRSNGRFHELMPHEYQLSIYNRIRNNWHNDRMGYGNIVYLETGTGKTYIAIMLLKYLYSERYVDYRMRLALEGGRSDLLAEESPVQL